MTNIEYIRTLSAEELAKFIIHAPIIYLTCPKPSCKKCEYECGGVECHRSCWVNFLNSEKQEDE